MLVFSGKAMSVVGAVAVATASFTLLCTFPTPSQVAAAEQEAPSGIVAAQVRKQGFTCENPVSAKRDSEPSKPHEAVWLLQCKKSIACASCRRWPQKLSGWRTERKLKAVSNW